MISLQGKTNFFERRVGEYQKAGVMSSKEDKEFKINADFWFAFTIFYFTFYFKFDLEQSCFVTYLPL